MNLEWYSRAYESSLVSSVLIHDQSKIWENNDDLFNTLFLLTQISEKVYWYSKFSKYITKEKRKKGMEQYIIYGGLN